MRRVTIILEVLILVGLTGCGKSKEKTIVGKWKEVGGTQIIEFSRDGTVSVGDEGQSPMTGEYKFIADNQIRMMLPLFGAVTAELSSSKDEITLVNPFGKVEKYWKLGTVGQRKEIEVIKISEDDVPGEYISKYDKKELLTINKDGTFKFKDDSSFGGPSVITGNWEINNDQITFYIYTEWHKKASLSLLSGEIKGSSIHSRGGTIWERKKDYIVY